MGILRSQANDVNSANNDSTNPADLPTTGQQQKIRNSLRYSIIDGTFYSIMVGFGESFFSNFAVFLKPTDFQLGLLGSLPQVFGFLCQLFTQKMVMLFHSRQTVVCLGVFLQACMYLPIAFTFFLGDSRVSYLIACVVVYQVCGSILVPAWNSWMGDLVDEKHRGRYFGKRNSILSTASFTAVLLGGYILKNFQGDPARQYLGFLILFSIAWLARTLSGIYLTQKYEPPYTAMPSSSITFREFFQRIRGTNFQMFVSFMLCMNFSVFVSAAFFAPHMLKDLQLSPMSFAMVQATPIITKLLVIPRWGLACDQFGTKKIMTLTSMMIPTVPVVWLFGGQVWYLMLIQVYSGFVWAGFEIASFNVMFETTHAQDRVSYISYYNVLNGVAILVGSMCGALIVQYNHLFLSGYLAVFLVSGLLRGVAAALFIRKIREMRTVSPISYGGLVLKIVGFGFPTMGLVHAPILFQKKKSPDTIAYRKKVEL